MSGGGGGFTTRTQLATERGQKPLPLAVTAGQRGDSPQFRAVLEGIRVPQPPSRNPVDQVRHRKNLPGCHWRLWDAWRCWIAVRNEAVIASINEWL